MSRIADVVVRATGARVRGRATCAGLCLALLAAALPARAQDLPPPEEDAPPPASAAETAPGATASPEPETAPRRDRRDDDEDEDDEEGFAIEAAYGVKTYPNARLPEGEGNPLLLSLRALDHKGLRSEFGLWFQRESYEVEERSGLAASVESLAVGVDLYLGIGVGPVEILGGGGLGASWADGTLATPLTDARPTTLSDPGVVGHYGAVAAVNIAFLRPVFRVRRDVDFSAGADSDAAGISGLSLLFGLGLELDNL